MDKTLFQSLCIKRPKRFRMIFVDMLSEYPITEIVLLPPPPPTTGERVGGRVKAIGMRCVNYQNHVVRQP